MSESRSSLLSRYVKLRVLPEKRNRNSGAPTPTLSEFTCFSKLPIELRLKIWKVVCFHGRNVDLWVVENEILQRVAFNRYDKEEYYDDPDEMTNIFHFKSNITTPEVLHCCREARAEGLKHFQLDFGTVHRLKLGATLNNEARVYINWQADTLCLMNPGTYCAKICQNLFPLIKVKKLQSMAVAVDLWWEFDYDEPAPITDPPTPLPWLEIWRAGIRGLTLFPSLYGIEDVNESLTAGTLMSKTPVIMKWKRFTEKFNCVEEILDDVKQEIENEICEKRKQQEQTSGDSETVSDVITNPEPKITLRDVVYNYAYVRPRESKGDWLSSS